MENVAKIVKKRLGRIKLNEGHQIVLRNEDGEPIGFDYEPDLYERELAEWEENELKAQDPLYAEQCEAEQWYKKACQAFKDQGIEVPEELINIMAKKMRKISLENERIKSIEDFKNEYADFFNELNKLGYDYEIKYDYPTPDEEGYTYLDNISKNGEYINYYTNNKVLISKLRQHMKNNNIDAEPIYGWGSI